MKTSLLGDDEPKPKVGRIIMDVITLAVPNMITMTFMLLAEFTNVVLVGHTGNPVALGALGMGNMMQNCIALSTGIGICGGMDTLVSQAYGAGRHDLTCLYLQRGRVITTLQLLWMLPVLWYSSEILVYIGQDPEVASSTADYNRASMWGLIALFNYNAALKFLQNRSESTPGAIVGVVTAVLHVGWCFLFVVHLGLGTAGAGYANAVTWFSQCLGINAYLVCYARKSGLSLRRMLWFEADSFREWREYMRYALPSTLQLCSEWWFWELCALVVGYLHDMRALAAHVAALNFVALSFMPALGLGSACTALVGAALGANSPRRARKTVIVCVIFNLFMWSVLCASIILGRGAIAEAYSDDAGICAVIENLLVIFAFAGFCDTSQSVMGSALRGMGRQKVAVWTYMITLYLISLPFGSFACFSLHLQVYGIWYSFALGTFLAAATFSYVLLRLDFKTLAHETVDRMKGEEEARCLANTSTTTEPPQISTPKSHHHH